MHAAPFDLDDGLRRVFAGLSPCGHLVFGPAHPFNQGACQSVAKRVLGESSGSKTNFRRSIVFGGHWDLRVGVRVHGAILCGKAHSIQFAHAMRFRPYGIICMLP